MKIYTDKIKVLNTTRFVYIPKKVIETEGLEIGDYVQIHLCKIESNTIHCKCKICEHESYHENEDAPYCTNCGSEEVEEVTNGS